MSWLRCLRCRLGWLGHDPDFDRPRPTEDWTEYPCRRCGAYLVPSIWAGLPGAPEDGAA